MLYDLVTFCKTMAISFRPVMIRLPLMAGCSWLSVIGWTDPNLFPSRGMNVHEASRPKAAVDTASSAQCHPPLGLPQSARVVRRSQPPLNCWTSTVGAWRLAAAPPADFARACFDSQVLSLQHYFIRSAG